MENKSYFIQLTACFIAYQRSTTQSAAPCTDELCNKFADFFSEKILKIRHQLDVLQTDASSNFQHFDNC